MPRGWVPGRSGSTVRDMKLRACFAALEQALAAVRRGIPLVDVATGCGYSDQAHLARDVKALTGTTVTGLLRESADSLPSESAH